MVWRPMSAELRFLKEAIAEHARKEGGERISWVRLPVPMGSVLAMGIIEFKDVSVDTARLVYCSQFGDLLQDCSGTQPSCCSLGSISSRKMSL